MTAAQLLHAAFALAGGANDAVLQPDGKIVAVGFQAYYPTPKGVQFALARYLAR